MSAVTKISEPPMESASVAAISTNARIDYILRFSKQAVLVVDESSAKYSHIGNLFLGGLTDDSNAAYVAASAQLNNIQIRCRIIEQLFPDVLFDPEQSLAVSIIRLSKATAQPISIVLDHAHLLSFQLIHELSYLAEISKKVNKTINVVMLGNYQTASIITAEKSLFKKKLAIVEADSGQLLNLDSKVFKFNNNNFFKVHAKKIAVFMVLLFSLLALAATLLQQRDLFSFSLLPQASKPQTTAVPNIFKSIAAPLVKTAQETKLPILVKNTQQADANDIYHALTMNSVDKPQLTLQKASVGDILNALEQAETKLTVKDAAAQLKKMIIQPEIIKPIKANTAQHSYNNSDYYLSQKNGYIIQFAGLNDVSEFDEIKLQLTKINYKSYYRLLNNKPFLVITSLVYKTKAQALAAISTLPTLIRQREPWVKEMKIVQEEIKHYQNSNN